MQQPSFLSGSPACLQPPHRSVVQLYCPGKTLVRRLYTRDPQTAIPNQHLLHYGPLWPQEQCLLCRKQEVLLKSEKSSFSSQNPQHGHPLGLQAPPTRRQQAVEHCARCERAGRSRRRGSQWCRRRGGCWCNGGGTNRDQRYRTSHNKHLGYGPSGKQTNPPHDAPGSGCSIKSKSVDDLLKKNQAKQSSPSSHTCPCPHSQATLRRSQSQKRSPPPRSGPWPATHASTCPSSTSPTHTLGGKVGVPEKNANHVLVLILLARLLDW